MATGNKPKLLSSRYAPVRDLPAALSARDARVEGGTPQVSVTTENNTNPRESPEESHVAENSVSTTHLEASSAYERTPPWIGRRSGIALVVITLASVAIALVALLDRPASEAETLPDSIMLSFLQRPGRADTVNNLRVTLSCDAAAPVVVEMSQVQGAAPVVWPPRCMSWVSVRWSWQCNATREPEREQIVRRAHPRIETVSHCSR
jgi:hypothetical protein